MADFEKIVKEHGGDISETAINAIASAIRTAVGNEFVDKLRYKQKLTELDELRERQQTVEDNATTAGKWKDKYEDLKRQYDDYKAEVKGKELRAAKETAYREALKDANLTESGMAKAIKYADWDKIVLDDSGKLKDAKDHIKAVREEWAEYISKTQQSGAHTSTPPANTGGNTMTKEEIMAITDTTARQRAIAENHSLFGF